MKRPRDSQRSRLYKWENENLKTAWLILDKDNTPLGEVGAQHLVNTVWQNPLLTGAAPTVKVMGNRGRGTADSHRILLSSSYVTTQTAWYVLHEATHVVMLREQPQVADHGPEFCDLYAYLLGKHTTASYEHVIESMKEAGLKTS